ncbi:MAG: tetratricopeptide repeat protein [Treponema sp.]|jgi:tetratricopeptide (TPR) repeat protein|nr:tetratricopeptide repeat protein [Treponema sp.]
MKTGKRLFCAAVIFCLAAAIFAQPLSDEAEALAGRGIAAHDSGDYEGALDYYRQVLELAPRHPVILYEMGFSYAAMGDDENALRMSDEGISAAREQGSDDILAALMDLKGSALDNLGRGEEALAVFEEAIGLGGNVTVYYNYALTSYKLERRGQAREALIAGLALNRNHPSSVYLLGRICVEEGRKTQGFYSLCYFLLLEPASGRAVEAYMSLDEMLKGSTTIGVRSAGSFTASDLMISLLSLDSDEASGLSDTEKLNAKLKKLFTALDESVENVEREAGDELWWDYYHPFFARIAASPYFDTYCKIIGLVANPDAQAWIDSGEGREEIDAFFTWLNE